MGRPRNLGGAFRCDHPARRPGYGDLDRGFHGFIKSDFATVGSHDDDLGAYAVFVEFTAHAAKLSFDHGLDESIADRGGGTEMFLPLRQHLIGDRDGNIWDLLREDRLYALLVARRQIGMEQHHGDRVDCAAGLDGLGERANLGFVERLDGLARRPNAFVDLEGIAALHERLRLHPGEVIVVPAVATSDEGNVPEAAGRNVCDRRALALEQRVGGDRGAESNAADSVGRAEGPEAGHDPFHGILWRRQVLPGPESLAVFVVGDEVRECPPDVNAQTITHPIGSPIP